MNRFFRHFCGLKKANEWLIYYYLFDYKLVVK